MTYDNCRTILAIAARLSRLMQLPWPVNPFGPSRRAVLATISRLFRENAHANLETELISDVAGALTS